MIGLEWSAARGALEAGGDRLLTTPQAGELLGLSPRTLEDWRMRGGGPVFRKLGRRRVLYRLSDLVAYVDDAGRVNTGGGFPAESGL